MEAVVKLDQGSYGGGNPASCATDTVELFGGAYRGARVLVTGHTGFKGAWLCEWLLQVGARVTGFALQPPTNPSLFDQLDLAHRVAHVIGDVRDPLAVQQLIEATRPDFVFHLAAQPLVRQSYADPAGTYATNVMGTVHVLDALRRLALPCVAVVVTTDKCYENREWVHSYREDDAMGGFDPYSSSKAAAELVVAAYRRSFFQGSRGTAVKVASARAGNVIGGGDWAADRIVPDCMRALQQAAVIAVRNKVSTRPWQHVLEPLSGYLWLAARLAGTAPQATDGDLASAFNFGPSLASNRTVAELVRTVLKHWPGRWEDRSDPNAVHEATLLNLATDKAHHRLGWQPVWDFERTIQETVTWYRSVAEAPARAADLTREQLRAYATDARRHGIAWANTTPAPISRVA
jgi:CDP-glucose 4,6-dehydratase